MNRKVRDWLKGRWLRVASLICALIIWQVVAEYVVMNRFILPSMTDVLSSFIALVESGVVFIDIGVSLIHFAIGMGAALLVGVSLGIAMGWFKTIDQIADPIIELLRPIPPLAWIPFAIVWFGLTQVSAGFVIFIGAVFPILINTYTGFKGVPKIFVEAAKMLGCTRNRDLIVHIAIPSAFPAVIAGVRIATGVAWMCLVAAEMFGVSKYGLGQKIWWYYHLHQMSNVVVYMALLGLIGLLLDMLLRSYVERHLLRWRAGEVR